MSFVKFIRNKKNKTRSINQEHILTKKYKPMFRADANLLGTLGRIVWKGDGGPEGMLRLVKYRRYIPTNSAPQAVALLTYA